MGRPAPAGGREQIRWRLADDDGGQPALLGEVERRAGRDELAGLELLHVRAKSIINRAPKVSQLPFNWTINAYRGCSHACVYCFARPTHEYLGFGIGEDFDRRIVIKINAVERLRVELRRASWRGRGDRDGHQHRPVPAGGGPLPPDPGDRRDAGGRRQPVLDPHQVDPDRPRRRPAGRRRAARLEVHTALSIGCLDEDVWRQAEPHTPHPLRRMETVARLNAAGVPCGVMIAPVLPGISDDPDQIEAVVKAAVAAGATSITPIMLHLRPGVREHYLEWLGATRPALAEATDRRYAGAYGPADERRDLAGMVRRMVAAHGGLRPVAPGRFSRRRAPATAPQEPESAQLSLL